MSAVAIDYIRALDYKGRLALPADVARDLGDRYRVRWDGSDALTVEGDPAGRRALRVTSRPTCATCRLTIPVEFRERLRLFPHTSVALARTARGLRLWPAPVPEPVLPPRPHPPRNARLTAAAAATIRQRYAAGEPPQSLAAAFGVGRSTVNDVIHGRTWRQA